SISCSGENSKSMAAGTYFPPAPFGTAASRRGFQSASHPVPCLFMRLQYAQEDEAFRDELDAWLDAHQPSEDRWREPKKSSPHMPQWAREWQPTLFDAGWLVPGWPPELGGRNATATQQMIYFEEINRREILRSANPQGLGIIAPSLNDYGTDAQKE